MVVSQAVSDTVQCLQAKLQELSELLSMNVDLLKQVQVCVKRQKSYQITLKSFQRGVDVKVASLVSKDAVIASLVSARIMCKRYPRYIVYSVFNILWTFLFSTLMSQDCNRRFITFQIEGATINETQLQSTTTQLCRSFDDYLTHCREYHSMFELLRDSNLLELPDVVNCDLLYASMPDVKNSALVLSTALSINKVSRPFIITQWI